MNERNCTNCRHYRRAESDTDEALDYGECRAHPPAISVIDDEPLTMFPQVDENCDCGEWSAAQ